MDRNKGVGTLRYDNGSSTPKTPQIYLIIQFDRYESCIIYVYETHRIPDIHTIDNTLKILPVRQCLTLQEIFLSNNFTLICILEI